MTDRPKTFNQEERLANIKQKYAGKNIPVRVAHNERVKLEKKYGEKIILGKLEDMTTDEEKMDKIEYEVLGKHLDKAVSGYKKADDSMKDGYKMQRLHNLLFARGKKIFLTTLGILLLLAIIKYLLT